jgi:hypothetical protein
MEITHQVIRILVVQSADGGHADVWNASAQSALRPENRHFEEVF